MGLVKLIEGTSSMNTSHIPVLPKQSCKHCHCKGELETYTARNQYRKKKKNIPRKGIPILLQKNIWTNPGNIKNANRYMDLEIGTEAAQLPEKEYINGIFFAVYFICAACFHCSKLFSPVVKRYLAIVSHW